MNKNEISKMLNDIGLMLELLGENSFKVRAYYNGARVIELLDEELEILIKKDRLKDIPGIGRALQEKIVEMVTTGKLEYYEKLKQEVPEDLFEMLKIPGLGPKKIQQLHKQLGINNVGELEYACIENRLIELKGFGLKTQNNILEGIANLKKYRGKFLISDGLYYGSILLEKLKLHPKVNRCSLAGSIRRNKEIIKDIDILVSIEEENRKEFIDYFLEQEEIQCVNERGETKVQVRLQSGMNADLRLVEDTQYPYALHHFTGSKEHNTAMRHRAKAMGMKINEYGLFLQDNTFVVCKDEREFFKKLKLQYIPPELRENNGEIQAAEDNAIPELIKREDLIGVFHNHTNYSDGINSIKEMALAAKKLGFKYIGISDHSKSAFYAKGLTLEEICKQHEEIAQLNKNLDGIYILKGIESDILSNGSLDYEDEVLSQFDYVIASVHSNFNMNKEEMTERILKAIENKHTRILGHPSGRLLLAREEYPIDMEKILKACHYNHVAVEINANPHRLDLDWKFCKMAKEIGVKIAIEPDAHTTGGLNDVLYGVGIGRKGWLSPKDVINTYELAHIKNLFKK